MRAQSVIGTIGDRCRVAWLRLRVIVGVLRSPSFVAPLLLLAGMGLGVYATYLLAGFAWAVVCASWWCIVSGIVLLRGIEQ